MKKLIKKAFTLVELLVVIAILAALATVGIVSFSSYTKRANLQSDNTLIAQINHHLAIMDSEDESHNTYTEMRSYLLQSGITIDDLAIDPASKGCRYIWNIEENKMYLLEGKDQIIQPVEDKMKIADGDKYKYFVPVKSDTEVEEGGLYEGYSCFLRKDATVNGALEVSASVDVGLNTKVSEVIYTNEGDTRNVVIRTDGNMCKLTVYAPKDHVEHYGYANEANVVKVANASYHEYGTITKLVVGSGKVQVENEGVVFEMVRDNFVKITGDKFIAEKEYNAMTTKPEMKEKLAKDTTALITNNGGNVMSADAETGVTASTTFEINNLGQLEAFRDATNSGQTFEGKTINLNCDINLTKAWKPISNYNRSATDFADACFQGTFNGKNHTIYGLTNEGLLLEDINSGKNNTTPEGYDEAAYGLFAGVGGNAKIMNLTLSNVNIVSFGSVLGDSVAALVGYALGSVHISNITVTGSIIGDEGVAGIVGRPYGYKDDQFTSSEQNPLTIENCTNNASITASGKAGGIAGSVSALAANKGYVTIKNCTNTGVVKSNGTYTKGHGYHFASTIATFGSYNSAYFVHSGNKNDGGSATSICHPDEKNAHTALNNYMFSGSEAKIETEAN